MRKHPHNFIEEVIFYVKYDARDEFVAFLQWVRYYIPLWIGMAVVVAAGAAYFNYGSHNRAVLGLAQVGSSYRNVAEAYHAFFEKNGIQLDLSEVAHVNESASQLKEKGAAINASFVLAGTSLGENAGKFVSLGSIKYAPGWLFHRGPEVSSPNPFSAMVGRTISIGPQGSFSNWSFRQLLAASGTPADGIGILELPDSEGVSRLLAGEIQAMWVIDSFTSPNIQLLAANDQLSVYDWSLAAAYVEKLPYLSELKLPAGYFDLAKARPSKDVALLSAAVTLLVESNLHPALQWGFLLAARDYQSQSHEDLSGGTVFPKYIDKSVPLSPVAEQYYETGVPLSFTYLPLFYASLIDRTWLWIAGALLFGYPAFLKLTHLREMNSVWTMRRNFEQLRDYEEQLVEAKTLEQFDATMGELKKFEEHVLEHWVDEENVKDYYALRTAFCRVAESSEKCRARLASGTAHG